MTPQISSSSSPVGARKRSMRISPPRTATTTFPGDAFLLERCKPVYETMPGWRVNIGDARKLTDLPGAARRYVDRLSELLGLPVTTISVGPDREQTIAVY